MNSTGDGVLWNDAGKYSILSVFSSIVIVIVSLATKAPSKEIEEDFEAVRLGNVSDK